MEVEGETAAATPAKTMVSTKMRIASFIVGNPSWNRIGGKLVFLLLKMIR
jgi:hypothetical protein